MVKGAPDFMRPVIQVMEKKGGAIGLDEQSSLAQVNDSANTKANLGYTSIGGSTATLQNVITGSIFTITANANAEKIIVALKQDAGAGTAKVRCAIYKHSDLSLVAVTPEYTLNLTASYQWFVFGFTSLVSLVANEVYLLVAWSEVGSTGVVQIAYTSGSANQGHTLNRTYDGNYPDPLPTPTHNNNQYSIYCQYYTGGFQTVKTLNFTTPTLPSGVSALIFSIMVTFRIWNSVSGDRVWCRVYVDDILLYSLSVISSTPTYYETAKDIAAGSHHADIDIWGGGTGQVDNARTTCGVGTMSTTLVKTVEIVISGDSKALIRVGGKSWSVAPTVTAEVRGDDSTVDKATVSQAVTQGGALYENSAALTTFIYQMLGYYAKSSVSNVPAFLTYSEDKAVKMMML